MQKKNPSPKYLFNNQQDKRSNQLDLLVCGCTGCSNNRHMQPDGEWKFPLGINKVKLSICLRCVFPLADCQHRNLLVVSQVRTSSANNLNCITYCSPQLQGLGAAVWPGNNQNKGSKSKHQVLETLEYFVIRFLFHSEFSFSVQFTLVSFFLYLLF